MLLISEVERQGQADLCEFDNGVVYKVSSRTAKSVSQRNPVTKTSKQNKQTKNTKQNYDFCITKQTKSHQI